MSEQRINPYEGLFLFSQAATANLTAAADHIKDILDRAGAELISLRKWDERRLAYAIRGNKRGVFFVVYLNAAADNMPVIERQCNLSEEILRAMITRADHIPMEQMQAADGRQQLADEAKLRASDAAAEGAAAAGAGSPDAEAVEDDESDDETSYAEPPGSSIRP
jgi:small subunit ribosomal protein S6